MEAYFENLCSMNRTNLRQAAYSRRSTGSWVLLIAGLIYFSGFSVYAFCAGGVGVWLGILLTIMTVLYVVFAVCAPEWEAARAAKREKERRGSAVRYRCSFYENGFRAGVSGKEGTKDIPYGKIVRVDRTKDLYLIRTENGTCPVARSGFQKGDPSRFLPFLRKKAADAKFSK